MTILLLALLSISACSRESMTCVKSATPAERLYGVVNRHTGKIISDGDIASALYREGEPLPDGEWVTIDATANKELRWLRLTAVPTQGGSLPKLWRYDRSKPERFLVMVTYGSNGSSTQVGLGEPFYFDMSRADAGKDEADYRKAVGYVVLELPNASADFIRRSHDKQLWKRPIELWPLYTSLVSSGVAFHEAWLLSFFQRDWRVNGVPSSTRRFLIDHRARASMRPPTESWQERQNARLHGIVWWAITQSDDPVDRALLSDAIAQRESYLEDEKWQERYLLHGDPYLQDLGAACRKYFPNETWWQTPEVLSAIKAADAAEAASKAPDPEPADSKKD